MAKVKVGIVFLVGLAYLDPVFLRPLDLENDVFYYIKRVEYADKDIEEENPEIGIVKLK